MRAQDLIKKLRKNKHKEVLVKIQGGLFYPVEAVKNYDGKVIIVCRDIASPAKMVEISNSDFMTFVKKQEK